MEYYIAMLKLLGGGQSAQFMPYLADKAIKDIEQNELIRQGASKLGISVSDDAVAAELKNADLPNDDVYRDLARIQLLVSKLQDEYFKPQVPVSAPQVHLMAMLLESEQQANEIRVRVENSDNFTELAGELSLDFFSKTNVGDFGWHPEDILNELLPAHLVAYAFSSEAGVLSPPLPDEEITKEVGYWLVRVLDRNEEEEEVHIQVMLLGSEEEAQEVRGRLEAGEDFATLAKEFSQLKGVEENEGEYSVTTGMISPAIDDFAFDPEVELETLSQPIRDETVTTKGGYWLVKIVAKDENRQIEDDDLDVLTFRAFDQWVSSLWDDPENEVDDSYLDLEKKTWAIEQAMKG
jgi:parvulin-like peptidyl-prolyl isomerase